MRNTELFDKIADAIEAEPKRYNQSVFGVDTACGTAHCVAGWVAVLEGCKPKRKKRSEHDDYWTNLVLPNGDWGDVEQFAQEKLGLTETDADNLFDGDWHPPTGSTVPAALRAIGRGADIECCNLDE